MSPAASRAVTDATGTVDEWQRVVAAGFRVPDHRTLSDLTIELVEMLGDPDPRVRDGLAYLVLATWLERGVYDELLTGLGDGMCEGLRTGLGEDHTDTVFRRSFSALVVTAAVERDSAAHLLHPDIVLRWADRGLHWFVNERDLRGWTDATGWAHAVAHGADLLGSLGKSRHLAREHLQVLLDALADRLARSEGQTMDAGEDDRLAHATVIILLRDAISADWLGGWLEKLVRAFDDDLSGARASVNLNTVRYLRALDTMLRLGAGSPRSGPDEAYFAGDPPIRDELLHRLEDVLRRYQPALYRAAL